MGLGTLKRGSGICGGHKGDVPAEVKSGVRLERTCCAKVLGHEILMHLVGGWIKAEKRMGSRTWKAMVPARDETGKLSEYSNDMVRLVF